MAKPTTRHALRFLKERMAPHGHWFLFGALAALAAAAAAFGYADITARAMDWLQSGDRRVIELAPVVIIALVLVRASAIYAQTQFNNIGVQHAILDLQALLFARLIEGDFARLQASASGEFVSQFSNDMTLIREAALRVAANLARSVLTILAALVFMFTRDWALALFLLVAYPIAFIPVIRLGERIRRNSRRAQEQAGEMTALLSEAFQGARTVKAFALEAFQKQRAHAAFRERMRLYLRILRSKAIVDPFLEVVGGLALAGLFAFAGWRALTGDMTAGDLVGFITAIAIASPEVRALGTLNAALNEGGAALDRVHSAVDAPARIEEAPDARALERAAGHVAFDAVSFAYPGGGRALDGLSFEARPGETIAFVGASGGGKSTLFNLSGGQRQRIALARALLSDAPILLLDEATSALDSDSEARIQQALSALSGRRTVLVIAHRLATVRKADRIHVVDAGRIIESGRHDELMAEGGAYARLAALQLS